MPVCCTTGLRQSPRPCLPVTKANIKPRSTCPSISHSGRLRSSSYILYSSYFPRRSVPCSLPSPPPPPPPPPPSLVGIARNVCLNRSTLTLPLTHIINQHNLSLSFSLKARVFSVSLTCIRSSGLRDRQGGQGRKGMFSGMQHKLRHLGDTAPLKRQAYASVSLKNLHQTQASALEPAMNFHKAEPRSSSGGGEHFSDPFWMLQDCSSAMTSDQNGNALVPNGSPPRSLWRSHEVGHGRDHQHQQQPSVVDSKLSTPGLGSPHGQDDGAVELPGISSDGKPESNETGNKRSHNRSVASKNLVSERKRRKKLNEGLFQLRSQVPKISKMDKASIIGDAIDYVRELQKELEEIESEIDDLEHKCTGSGGDEAGSMEAATGENFSAPTSSNPGSGAEFLQGGGDVGIETTVTIESSVDKVSGDSTQMKLPARLGQKILEVDVIRLEEQTYHLRIFCQRGPGVLVQLVQAVESLGVQVLNAHHTAFQENILNSFIAEMKDPEMETEDVRRSIFSVAAQYGLVQG